MRFVVLAVAVVALGGCNKDEGSRSSAQTAPSSGSRAPAPDPSTNVSTPSEFNQDVNRICNAEKLSGATELEEAYRAFHVAKWLGANVRTEEGRQLLGKLARLGDPRKKTAALAAQAEKSAVPDCALVRTWSGPK